MSKQPKIPTLTPKEAKPKQVLAEKVKAQTTGSVIKK